MAAAVSTATMTAGFADGPAIGTDRNWSVVGASTIGLTFSLGTLLLYTFGVFVGPLTREFGWTRTQLSGALAMSQYTFALTAPVWGLLIDRFGPRAVLLPSVVFMAVLVGSLSLLGSLWQYYLTFIAASFCAGGATPIGYSAVLVSRFERRLGLALGLALMGVGLGAAVLPPLSAVLIVDFGWRGAYAGLGVLTFVFTVPAALVATRSAGGPAQVRTSTAATLPVLPLLRSRAFVLICAIFVLLGTTSIGTLTSIVPMMIGRGFTPQAAAQLTGLTGLAAIAGRGGIGWVLDRVYPPFVIAAMALVALAAFLIAAYGSGPASGYTLAVLLGGVVGAEVDFTAFFVRRYFGQAMFGRLYGVAFGVFLIGSGTGPVLASASFDHFGSYRPGALLFAAGAVLVVLLALAMPKPPAPRRHG